MYTAEQVLYDSVEGRIDRDDNLEDVNIAERDVGPNGVKYGSEIMGILSGLSYLIVISQFNSHWPGVDLSGKLQNFCHSVPLLRPCS